MRIINLSETNHKFEKQNLVTQKDRSGLHDTLKCAYCGLVGKSRRLGTVEIAESNKNKIACPKAPSVKQIKVIRCSALGKKFVNLTPGSVHDVVDPPDGFDNSRGVWVMGVGEPVLLLFGEYQPNDH